MRHTTLSDIAQVIGGRLEPSEAENVFVSGVSTDTRELHPGDLFFALVAERDGHDFLPQALEAGALAAVISKDIQLDCPNIKVSDTLRALNNLAAHYRRTFRQRASGKLPVIGITGSVGKTTTRAAIAHILSGKYQTMQSERNFNNLIGLALSILRIEEYHEIAVLELGINVPGEMVRLASMAAPDYAVILNVTPVHLEGLGSLDNVASEKLKLLEYMGDGKAFLNADDVRLVSQKIVPAERVITFGIADNADYQVTDFSNDARGKASFKINGREIHMSIGGKGAAYSAACAWAVAVEFDIPEDEIVARLAEFSGVQSRLQIRRYGEVTVLDDVYNSSPKAAEAALELLSTMDGSRKIAVLADMLELGNERLKFHDELGRIAAKTGVAFLILYGELSKVAAESAVAAGMSPNTVFWTDDFSELETAVMGALKPGDVVLLKGSRSMGMERILKKLEETL